MMAVVNNVDVGGLNPAELECMASVEPQGSARRMRRRPAVKGQDATGHGIDCGLVAASGFIYPSNGVLEVRNKGLNAILLLIGVATTQLTMRGTS